MGKTSGSLLEPATDARADDSPPQHPIRAALAVTVIGYVVLTGLMLGIGLLLTHALNGSVGSWDRHVSDYFARHRTSGLNDLTKRATSGVSKFVRVGHADLPAIIVAAVVVTFLARRGRWREGVLIAIAFALAFYATGFSGKMVHSADRGASWQPITTGTTKVSPGRM